MKMQHPIIPVWLTIMKSAGLTATDVCLASGVAPSTFSHLRSNKRWPSLKMARRINVAIGQLTGRSGDDVDNLVDKMWATGGKVTASLMAGDNCPLSPQVIPAIVHRPVRRKNRINKGVL